MIRSGIYKIVNLHNNKVYIGSSINLYKRQKEHFNNLKRNAHPNSHLQSSYNKYGKDKFIWEIIEYVEFEGDTDIFKDNLLAREQYWIDEYYGEKCYNLFPKAGNSLGVKLSEEHKAKLSKAHSGDKHYFWGKHLSEEHKAKLSKAHTGKVLSEEHKQKLKDNHRGNTGNKLSDETKNKLSKAHTGKVLSEEHKQKIRDNHVGMSGRVHSEDSKQLMKERALANETSFKKGDIRISKKVINLDTGLKFDSITEASLFYGISNPRIGEACRGIRETAGGFSWRYLDE